MKKVAVTLGLIIALLAAAMFVVPKTVDWNAYRPEIANAVYQLTGYEVAINGDMNFVMLPKPALTVTDVTLKVANVEQELIRLQKLAFRIALAPLLTGRLQFEQLRLVAPELQIIEDAEGRSNWQIAREPGAADRRDINFSKWVLLDDIAVENGTLIYHDLGRDHKVRFEKINLTATAASMTGPFAASGKFVLADRPLNFDLRTGRRSAEGRIPLRRLLLSLPDASGTLRISGSLSDLGPDGTLRGRLSANTRDVRKMAAALFGPSDLLRLPQTPIAIEADIRLNRDALSLNDIALRIAGSNLSGAVNVRLQDTPRFDAAFAAGRVDLDALLAKAGTMEVNRDSISALLSALDLPKNLEGNADIAIDGVTLRGGVLRQVRLAVEIAGGVILLDKASALLPGGSQFLVSGIGQKSEDAPLFDGRIEFRSNNFHRFLSWAGWDASKFGLNQLGTASLTSNLRVTPDLLEIHDALFQLDSSAALGGISYRLQGRPSFGLDLTIDKLNLDRYLQPTTKDPNPALATLYRADLLNAFDTNLRLRIDDLTYHSTPYKGLSVELNLTQGKLAVREARIGDVAGSELALTAVAHDFAGAPSYSAKFISFAIV